MANLYAALEVPPNADEPTIKRAYRKAASKHHPDREGGDNERMQLVQRAYDVLSDAERRKRYDESGEDDSTGDAVAELLQTMLRLALQIVDAADVSYTDVIAKKREHVTAGRQNAVMERKKRELLAEKRENAMRRINRKGGAPNILADMLASEIEKVRRAMAACDADIAKFDSLAALIDEYEYRVEQRPANMPHTWTHYGPTGGLGSILGGGRW